MGMGVLIVSLVLLLGGLGENGCVLGFEEGRVEGGGKGGFV